MRIRIFDINLFFVIVIILLCNFVTPVANSGIYGKQVASSSFSQNDAGSGSDAPSNPSLLAINLNTDYYGQLNASSMTNEGHHGDFSDGYNFQINTPGLLNVSTQITLRGGLQVLIQILNVDGIIYMAEFQRSENYISFQVPIIKSGSYYYTIEFYDYYINYNFRVDFLKGLPVELQQNDASTEKDASKDYPSFIELGQNYSGKIGLGYVEDNGLWDYEDAYLVDLPSQGYLTITTQLSRQIAVSFGIGVIQYHAELLHPTSNRPIYWQTITPIYSYNKSNIVISSPIPIMGKFVLLFSSHAVYGTSTPELQLQYNFTTSFINATLPQQNDFNQNKDVVCNSNSNGNFADTEIPLNQTFIGRAGPGYFESTDKCFVEDSSDCVMFTMDNAGKLFISFTDTLDPELDNAPDRGSNSMQLDLVDLSIESCPSCYPIVRGSDRLNQSSFQIQKDLPKGNYGLIIYAFKRISYSLTLTANLNLNYDLNPAFDSTSYIVSNFDSSSSDLTFALFFISIISIIGLAFFIKSTRENRENDSMKFRRGQEFYEKPRVIQNQKQNHNEIPSQQLVNPSALKMEKNVFCIYCGNLVEPGDVYCQYCGSKLS